MIIGKLIPAGTGMKRYRDVHLSTDDALGTDYEEDFRDYDGDEEVEILAEQPEETADVDVEERLDEEAADVAEEPETVTAQVGSEE